MTHMCSAEAGRACGTRPPCIIRKSRNPGCDPPAAAAAGAEQDQRTRRGRGGGEGIASAAATAEAAAADHRDPPAHCCGRWWWWQAREIAMDRDAAAMLRSTAQEGLGLTASMDRRVPVWCTEENQTPRTVLLFMDTEIRHVAIIRLQAQVVYP